MAGGDDYTPVVERFARRSRRQGESADPVRYLGGLEVGTNLLARLDADKQEAARHELAHARSRSDSSACLPAWPRGPSPGSPRA